MRLHCDARFAFGLLPIVLLTLLAGCNRSPRTVGMAPRLSTGGAEEEMPTLRNVADPNAPYTLRPAAGAPEAQAAVDGETGAAPLCEESQLSLFETRSRMNGQHHSVQLTLENQGSPCRLRGFPSVTLLDPEGTAIAGVSFQRVSAAAVAATLGPPVVAAAASAVQPPEVMLSEHRDAVFEIGWTSGPRCPVVSRIAVAAPGSTVFGYVPRQLQLCGGRVLITAVAPGGAE